MGVNMNIDYESLRNDLINYFGTAMMYNPQAVIQLSQVENASNSELETIAIRNGFDLRNYKVFTLNL